jgi:hypothetical protein
MIMRPDRDDVLLLQQEEAILLAMSEELTRFAAQRRGAIAQYLDAVAIATTAANLQQLRIDFSMHAARDYAQRALQFHAMMQTLMTGSDSDDIADE